MLANVDNEMLNELKSTYGQRTYGRGLDIRLMSVGIAYQQTSDQVRDSNICGSQGCSTGAAQELS